MTSSKRHWMLFVVQLLLYTGMLCLDLYLINWYDSFYSAIQDKSKEQFSRELLVFIALTLSQALVLGLISFNSEVYEAELKSFFVNYWVNFEWQSGKDIKISKGDQKIIDDASLSAEKVAIILPAIIFNVFKAVIFLALLSQYPASLFDDLIGFGGMDKFSLSIFGVFYLMIQVIILKKSNKWVSKSENIKRSLEAKTRYKLLSSDIKNKEQLVRLAKMYVRGVVKIRMLVGRAHGINVVSINSISSLSFIIPFIAIFSSYSTGLITFGELMKISATYSGFQSSAMYVFNTYKEALRGVSALNRLNVMKI